jgi:hypothetical protein
LWKPPRLKWFAHQGLSTYSPPLSCYELLVIAFSTTNISPFGNSHSTSAEFFGFYIFSLFPPDFAFCSLSAPLAFFTTREKPKTQPELKKKLEMGFPERGGGEKNCNRGLWLGFVVGK